MVLTLTPGAVLADVKDGPHPFHGQQIDWEPCLTPDEIAETGVGEGDPDWLPRLECGTVTVPVDHGDPEGELLDLALIRQPAQGPRRGSLVFDFGGPGVSGVDTFLGGPLPLGRGVRENFDLVSFDPRGVGASGGFTCRGHADLDRLLTEIRRLDPDDLPERALRKLERVAHAFTVGCVDAVGTDFLAHIGTVNVSRDLDLVRDALGEARLDYVGYSYGTSIGALYAEMYPERAGALVLDGAVPIDGDVITDTVEQAVGLQTAWESFVAYCLDAAPECPFTGMGTAATEMEDILAGLDSDPLRVDDRPLDRYGLLDLVRGSLHTEQLWPGTALLLARLAEGERGGFVPDYLAGLRGDVADDLPGAEEAAYVAVRCADHARPTDTDAYLQGARRAEEASPLFGGAEVWRMLPCATWPDTEVMPTGVSAPMAPPVLVVGTVGDPATPYTWARELTEQLDSARLLTYEGGGHTAYGSGRGCVDDAVEAYLVRGVLPAEDTTCPAER
ncbi:alpha/beta hydrolase [Nocardiopsis sp. MG754419]|uniref:alpha/beta hydrolase n=1 Tax=Nocardiopsis sp. MG754419 TaxID=2259865 RepID=UPI001BA597ED|nr:alpha/beta hydrolase [Nocardiopsis sp. MG754419]MBR8744493.1 alpha/beta hydrolase [Nocardiopsis sp. MG754419]